MLMRFRDSRWHALGHTAGKQGLDACLLWILPDSGEMTAGWAEQGLGGVASGYFGVGILVERWRGQQRSSEA